MPLNDARTQEVVREVLEVAGTQRPLDDALSGFITLLFERGIGEDLDQYERHELVALSLTAWDNLAKRKPGEAKVSVVNPEITARTEYGYESPVTVIEVVNDNMPFLVDSVVGELQDRGLDVHLVLHPVYNVQRSKNGDRKGVLTAAASKEELGRGVVQESLIHVHVDRIDRDSERTDLAKTLEDVLEEVRIAVEDWPTMTGRMAQLVENLLQTPPPVEENELEETVEFLRWLAQNNFTFLGMREYRFDPRSSDGAPELVDGTGLGVLRDPDVMVLRRGREMVNFTPELREFMLQPVLLIVTKANVRSRVHRRTHMDYIGIKLYDKKGNLAGELRLVGLFTSTAYTRSVRKIPYLRRKMEEVVTKSGLDTEGHSGKILYNVLEQYPRDELIQTDVSTLSDLALSIMQLDEHPRLRVLSRIDKFDRFVSILVFVPKDRMSTRVRLRVGDYLAEVYAGRVSAYYPSFPEGPLARVHYIIGRYEGETPIPTQGELEAHISQIIKTWGDHLTQAIAQNVDQPSDIQSLQKRYGGAFGAAYQDSYAPQIAIRDLKVIERLSSEKSIAFDFYELDAQDDHLLRFGLKVYHVGDPIPLSERVPVLENMGFHVINERTFEISPREEQAVWLHDMTLTSDEQPTAAFNVISPLLEEMFAHVWGGDAEDDGYNGLALRAGLGWREIATLRAYSRYLRQVRVPFSQGYMWTTLNRHHGVAARLVRLFATRFDPNFDGGDAARAKQCDAIVGEIEDALAAVESLDEDRIIRRFVNLIKSTLRTNVYQRDAHGAEKSTISLKLDPRAIDDLPEPKPYREIFVYSPRVEGVHLRFGAVARGGLRWSDRPQDFRTEVLGLVKAQQVKNAVIVPVGAKGGFVPKQLPTSGGRDAFFNEGVAAYKLFISSLLDITDNIDVDATVAPRRVKRHDGDDPYLVVAADKGTATFSDTANGISLSRNFWLGDAFASGGSAGYDHKKMGITARGGWEAVKRHFREMDIDTQTTPFTVVGVGDMSGDVFGNGMLLSEKICLLAAFDHRDIFIDPVPDPASTFAERKRLFEMGRSSWQDYNPELISPGGGVFSRREKSIPLSDEMRKLLGLTAKSAPPNEIMRAILKMGADLMWFGGIGTYIRATSESDDQVGDRANDPIRITAPELKVKVIGEGANLGATQRARIEFAAAGGRVNSDAIDNSAGVNSSDMEVNIKIALGAVVRDGRLTLESRNRLLAEMTEDVSGLVLRNNYLQTLALSLDQRRGMEEFSFQTRFMHDLEGRGLLNRQVEDLPDDLALMEREKAGKALVRPELAVLLAYAKLTLYDRLLESSVPDDAYLGKELMRYFPTELQRRFPEAIEGHRLRREIVATMLANSIINRGGATLVNRAVDQTGASVAEIAQAFAAVRDSYQMTELNGDIDALDNNVASELQLRFYADVQNLLRDQVMWFLRNVSFAEGLAQVITHYREGIDKVYTNLGTILPAALARQLDNTTKSYVKQKAPEGLARKIASLPYLSATGDIVLVSRQTNRDVVEVAESFFAIGEMFDTAPLHRAASTMKIADYYDRLALSRTLESLASAQRRITVMAMADGGSGREGLSSWMDGQGEDVTRTRRALKELVKQGPISLSRLAVGSSLLHDLIREQ